MSDRICSFIVVLERDIRDDDSEHIANALRMVKGVCSVTPTVSDYPVLIAKMQLRNETRTKLFDAIEKILDDGNS